ncbi:MAG: hypothetical protein QNJ57_12075 [Flavobacteriaceae bacterium]|nr:hypothetical protein [Flavobacteriaceae bacterium]
MKKLLLLFILYLFSFAIVSAQEQPDYTQIKFRQKVKEYKKSAPKIDGLGIDKELIGDIVKLLGKSFYNEQERDEIVERIWLSFTDPKKFDMVFRDYAIRTLPDWNKKNFRGEIVLEPNPYLSDWTKSYDELTYFKSAMHRILMYHGLMGYGEDAKNTKKSLQKIKYISKYQFPNPTSSDYTNSYLNKMAYAVNKKGLSVLISNGNYEFLICEKDKKDQLVSLFSKMNWEFVKP